MDEEVIGKLLWKIICYTIGPICILIGGAITIIGIPLLFLGIIPGVITMVFGGFVTIIGWLFIAAGNPKTHEEMIDMEAKEILNEKIHTAEIDAAVSKMRKEI